MILIFILAHSFHCEVILSSNLLLYYTFIFLFGCISPVLHRVFVPNPKYDLHTISTGFYIIIAPFDTFIYLH